MSINSSLKLNEKQILFCEEYMQNGYNASAAYRVAYQNDNDGTCKVNGCNLLKKKGIQEEIKRIEGDYRLLGYSLGINKNLILKILFNQFYAQKEGKSGVVPDNIAINNAINTWAKLSGEFAADKKEITIDLEDKGLDTDPSTLSNEDREKMRITILKELSK